MLVNTIEKYLQKVQIRFYNLSIDFFPKNQMLTTKIPLKSSFFNFNTFFLWINKQYFHGDKNNGYGNH